jgi:hypothetical protein
MNNGICKEREEDGKRYHVIVSYSSCGLVLPMKSSAINSTDGMSVNVDIGLCCDGIGGKPFRLVVEVVEMVEMVDVVEAEMEAEVEVRVVAEGVVEMEVGVVEVVVVEVVEAVNAEVGVYVEVEEVVAGVELAVE